MSDVQEGAESAQDQATQEATGPAVDPAKEVDFGPLVTALAGAGVILEDGDDVLTVASTTIGALSERVGDLETAHGEVTAERDALQEKLSHAEKAPKAKTVAAPTRRKVGPLKDQPEPSQEASAELLAIIREATTVDLVFSDGRQELAGLPAKRIEGDAWALRGSIAGVRLKGVELMVHGPAHGGSPYMLAGYGLVLDGKQVAWAPRPEVLAIGPNQQVNLSDDVVF